MKFDVRRHRWLESRPLNCELTPEREREREVCEQTQTANASSVGGLIAAFENHSVARKRSVNLTALCCVSALARSALTITTTITTTTTTNTTITPTASNVLSDATQIHWIDYHRHQCFLPCHRSRSSLREERKHSLRCGHNLQRKINHILIIEAQLRL